MSFPPLYNFITDIPFKNISDDIGNGESRLGGKVDKKKKSLGKFIY